LIIRWPAAEAPKISLRRVGEDGKAAAPSNLDDILSEIMAAAEQDNANIKVNEAIANIGAASKEKGNAAYKSGASCSSTGTASAQLSHGKRRTKSDLS
jgi:hypothetical protein